jgi:hypothetical protein
MHITERQTHDAPIAAVADFDRWALCDIEQEPRPNSMGEFMATVGLLLKRKAANAIELTRAEGVVVE